MWFFIDAHTGLHNCVHYYGYICVNSAKVPWHFVFLQKKLKNIYIILNPPSEMLFDMITENWAHFCTIPSKNRSHQTMENFLCGRVSHLSLPFLGKSGCTRVPQVYHTVKKHEMIISQMWKRSPYILSFILARNIQNTCHSPWILIIM